MGNLTAKQKQVINNPLARTIALWNQDPVLFVKTAFVESPTIMPWQKDFMNAVRDNFQTAVKSGNGVGKSTTDAWLILWWLITHYPAMAVCIGPSEQTVLDSVWKEVGSWYEKLKPEFKKLYEYQRSGKLILKSNPQDCFATVAIANKENPNCMAGKHSDHMLMVCDEAAGLDTVVFEYIYGGLKNDNSRLVLTGNPNQLDGFFYRIFEDDLPNWKKFTVTVLNRKQVPEWQFNDDKIANLKATFDANVFRWKVMGEFPLENTEGVISLPAAQAASKRTPEEFPTMIGPVIWGVDVAQKTGSDSSVLCKRQANACFEIKKWKAKDNVEIASLIAKEYWATPDKLKPKKICIDWTGVGGGVYDICLKQYNLPVKKVVVNSTAFDKEAYYSIRDELWFRCAEWMMEPDTRIPDDQVLIKELCLPNADLQRGRYKVESKVEIRKKGRKSPDMADALCLTFAARFEEKGYELRDAQYENIDYGWVV